MVKVNEFINFFTRGAGGDVAKKTQCVSYIVTDNTWSHVCTFSRPTDFLTRLISERKKRFSPHVSVTENNKVLPNSAPTIQVNFTLRNWLHLRPAIKWLEIGQGPGATSFRCQLGWIIQSVMNQLLPFIGQTPDGRDQLCRLCSVRIHSRRAFYYDTLLIWPPN